MPNRFCAICGISIDEDSPHFGMCLKCYLKENPLYELPESFSVNICIDCGKYSKKDTWFEPVNDDMISILQEIILKFILKTQIKNEQIEFLIEINEDDIEYSSKDLIKAVEVLVNGRLKDSKYISHQQTIKLILNHILCRDCSNLRGGTYFVSILQLRVKNDSQLDLLDKILDKIDDYVKTLYNKDHRHFISKVEDQRYGVDLYLSTNELMNHIIKFLKINHHFLLKRSKKLVGRDNQKGKNLYRLKASIKFLPIAPYDIVIIENEEYIVENITGNKIILRGDNNKKLIKDYSYFFNGNIEKKNNEAN
ncbi:MAG: NMD3-related protein [Candidatus Hermodarchaeota archaeon]